MKSENEMEAYTGTDILEAMAEAINYNTFLLGLITPFVSSSDRILDFGAGIGTFAKEFLNKANSIVCVEPDEVQQALIKNLGLEVVGDVSKLPSDSIDFVYSLNVFEHIENDSDAMNEVKRILKSGGKALIYVPAMQVLFSSMDRKVGHFRRYSKRDLASLADSSGLRIKSLVYVDSIGFFATLLYKTFGNKSGNLSVTAVKAYDKVAFPLSRFFDKFTQSYFGKNLALVLEKE